MEILSKQHIPGKGDVLVATAEGDLRQYMGTKVEYDGSWWEIINAEAFMTLMDPIFRDEKTPVGFIVKQTEPPETTHDLILAELSDAIGCFLHYDRKEDEDLPRGAIEDAIKKGEVTIEELVNCFRTKLGATPMQPIDYFRDMLTATGIVFDERPASIPLACPVDACTGISIDVTDPFNMTMDECQIGNIIASFVFCTETGQLLSIESEAKKE